MKPSEYLLMLKKETAKQVKGLDPKSRKFIKIIGKVDQEYAQKLDKQFLDKDKITNKIKDNSLSKINFDNHYISVKEILKLLEE